MSSLILLGNRSIVSIRPLIIFEPARVMLSVASPLKPSNPRQPFEQKIALVAVAGVLIALSIYGCAIERDIISPGALPEISPVALPFSFFATKLPPLTTTSPVEEMTIACPDIGAFTLSCDGGACSINHNIFVTANFHIFNETLVYR